MYILILLIIIFIQNSKPQSQQVQGKHLQWTNCRLSYLWFYNCWCWNKSDTSYTTF